ncbi:hypothetical protein H206_05277 [Candidatus Electrothrix aarhusensis]|uniref:Uncharacterized protein n=1 Tax=Candidatus Electrothrix aarhusensis TaxID=1859131 RepID=A0A3S3QIB1_9BACT|nr:hypothetical protein H206_05277 [Candidatus Electrothrix aarhusensis]
MGAALAEMRILQELYAISPSLLIVKESRIRYKRNGNELIR